MQLFEQDEVFFNFKINIKMQTKFETKKIRYASADTSEKIYQEIKDRAADYFNENNLPKHATKLMFFKSLTLLAVIELGYFSLSQVNSVGSLFGVYFILTFAMLLLSINLGHDAAHRAVTGNRKLDNFIFQSVFAMQGLSGYFWQMRHNYSHHSLPNVVEHDTDMEMTDLVLMEVDIEKKQWFHRYQHIYAPFLYAFTSFYLLFIQDFKFFIYPEQANLTFTKAPLIEWVKMIFSKIMYFVTMFGLPLYFTDIPFLQILTAWVIVHMILSIFVTFTFFISHHVEELEYIEADKSSGQNVIADSWIRHQIVTTIDFNPDSAVANFIFGGFNIHVAHHVFPEASHEHYTALTRIIRDVLEEKGVGDWYKSFTFFEGCRSHLRLLKNVSEQLFANEIERDFEIFDEPLFI